MNGLETASSGAAGTEKGKSGSVASGERVEPEPTLLRSRRLLDRDPPFPFRLGGGGSPVGNAGEPEDWKEVDDRALSKLGRLRSSYSSMASRLTEIASEGAEE
jgi:hypothetical protein